jgi:YVTN family beta-propeller protein
MRRAIGFSFCAVLALVLCLTASDLAAGGQRQKDTQVGGNVLPGLAISPDGKTLYVANYLNDSLSIVNTATRQVSKEVVFFAPGRKEAIGEMPYWLIREAQASQKEPSLVVIFCIVDGMELHSARPFDRVI